MATSSRPRRPRALAVALAGAVLLSSQSPAFAPSPVPKAARRLAVAAPLVALFGGGSPLEAIPMMERFDGSFIDPEHMCGEECIRTINAQGGFAQIIGRDKPDEKSWAVLARYDNKDITADFSSRGGPKEFKGTFFSKNGEKGIKWQDGNSWEKMEYKVFASPFEIGEREGKLRQEKLAAQAAATGKK